MGLTRQEERTCVHDSMRMGWGSGGGDDGGHGHCVTAVAKLMYPCMHSAHVCVCERCVCARVSLCLCSDMYVLRTRLFFPHGARASAGFATKPQLSGTVKQVMGQKIQQLISP
jgi:hypothetical protein